MVFPERFSNLPEYAFPRLRALLDGLPAGGPEIAMSIGEPKHAFPEFVPEILAKYAHEFGKYPQNEGTAELRQAISDWIERRYTATVNPETEIFALNGTREGLFNAALALCPEIKNGKRPKVLIPNPFYQVYAVATAAVEADPVFVDCPAVDGFLPRFERLDAAILDQTAIVYVCSPSNPHGAIADEAYWIQLLALADKYDFKIFADECYSEIYRDHAPIGALEVAKKIGADPERLVIFHSLSKRSNLPGLRSGFAASGPLNIAALKQLRAYAGAPLPLPLQRVATAVWQDEAHVTKNRDLYREKYEIADQVFAGLQGYHPPSAGFFLWLPVEDGEAATQKLWTTSGVKVLPGAYLARDFQGNNPGQGYIRAAMVAETQEMKRGLEAIRSCIY